MNDLLYILKKFFIKVNNSNSLKGNKGHISKHKNINNSYISGNVNCPSIKYLTNSTLSGNIDLGDNIEIQDSSLCGNIKIGDNSRIKGVSINGKNIQIGNFTSIWGPNVYIRQNINPISIGNFCSIAKNVSIQEFNHNSKKISTYFIGQNIFNENWANERISKGAISILNDVWIGERCTILGGVSIGNGCIIGAGSIITKDIPNYAIAVGSPAKVIGYRFSPEVIRALLNLKWWNWNIEKIKENKHLFEGELNLKNLNSLL